MMNCIYFACWGGPETAGRPRLATGWCFDAAGRPVVPGAGPGKPAEGVLLDDRNPPALSSIPEAVRLLKRISGPIVCDFERPPSPAADALIRALAGRELIVPEAYAHLPHTAVLVGPYRPGIGFLRWLDEKKSRYGRVVLDGGEIACRVPVPALPSGPVLSPRGEGFPCPGAMCRYRRSGDSLVFFDTPQTLRSRAEAAGCPVILSDAGL